jgi:hypothetical protein
VGCTVTLLLGLPSLGHRAASAVPDAPEWVRLGQPIDSSDIPQGDHSYLVSWVREHARPAPDYLVGLFGRHDVVILGEFHHIREHKDLVADLLPRLYHEAGVRCLAWEFSPSSKNERLDALTMAPTFDAGAVLDLARESVGWNSASHWDFVEAVWRLNHSLSPGEEPMRMLGLDSDWDPVGTYLAWRTAPEGSPERERALASSKGRDPHMARIVKTEILGRGRKGLVFVGRSHDFTHHQFGPDMNGGRDIMGRLLYEEFGDRVFQVWLDRSMLGFVRAIDEEAGLRFVGFDLYDSPFASVLSTGPNSVPDAPGVTLDRIARGYVDFGPRSELHTNETIAGFVTPEMFDRYQDYYELDYERPFATAAEVDEYLRAHRWPRP